MSGDFVGSDVHKKPTGLASGFILGLVNASAIWLKRQRRYRYLPMQGMKAVRFIVVSSFVVTYVDGDRCVESREYMMRPCRQDRETERRREKSIEGERKKKNL